MKKLNRKPFSSKMISPKRRKSSLSHALLALYAGVSPRAAALVALRMNPGRSTIEARANSRVIVYERHLITLIISDMSYINFQLSPASAPLFETIPKCITFFLSKAGC